MFQIQRLKIQCFRLNLKQPEAMWGVCLDLLRPPMTTNGPGCSDCRHWFLRGWRESEEPFSNEGMLISGFQNDWFIYKNTCDYRNKHGSSLTHLMWRQLCWRRRCYKWHPEAQRDGTLHQVLWMCLWVHSKSTKKGGNYEVTLTNV